MFLIWLPFDLNAWPMFMSQRFVPVREISHLLTQREEEFLKSKVRTKFVTFSWQLRATLTWVFPSQMSCMLVWWKVHDFQSTNFVIRKTQTYFVIFSRLQCHKHVMSLVQALKNHPLKWLIHLLNFWGFTYTHILQTIVPGVLCVDEVDLEPGHIPGESGARGVVRWAPGPCNARWRLCRRVHLQEGKIACWMRNCLWFLAGCVVLFLVARGDSRGHTIPATVEDHTYLKVNITTCVMDSQKRWPDFWQDHILRT